MKNTKHGLSRNNKVYIAWCNLKKRCYNPNDVRYVNYGAKGVLVHESFKDDFLAFYNEIGDPPDVNRRWSIDRIDHKKNYEPGNLRWATDAQQARNRGKPKTNTSNVTGIAWDSKVHPNKTKTSLYATAEWCEYRDNVKVSKKKCFSVKKLGLLEAFAAACVYREAKLEELNQLGYDYSDNHGK